MRDTIRGFFWAALTAFLLAASAQAAPLFFDNFDNSFPGEPALLNSIWPKWPNATDWMNLSDNHDHTRLTTSCGSCTNSVKVDEMYHMTLANYHDFGATAVGVTATAWLWDDLEFKYGVPTGVPPYPVNIFVGFFGESPTGPTGNTDYLLLGLDPTFANNNIYGYRSLTGGNGTTSITRSNAVAGSVDGSHWIKLAIKADSLASGGHVGFYINDVLVGTAHRQPGVSLRYFFMGNLNVGGGLTSNYENFWFDDVSIDVAIPQISDITVSSGMVTINFTSSDTSELASAFTLLSSSAVNGVYSSAADASITGSGGSYRATIHTNGDAQFYRIQR
jgi:hypothetical protein